MATTDNSGIEISYSVSGSGPGLVLIHGTGGSGVTTWGEIAPLLAADHTVVVPDLRGCGSPERGEHPLTLADLAADVEAVVRAAGLERFDLAGFSLGAAVAAQLAASNPQQVTSLALIAPPAAAADARAKLQFELWADLVAADPGLFARLWLLTGFSPNFISAIPRAQIDRAAHFPIEQATADQSRLGAELDLSEIVTAIEARTLVIAASHDVINPPAAARALAGQIAQADYRELDSGHLIVLEDPQALVKALAGFLGGSDAPVSEQPSAGDGAVAR